MNCTHLNNGFCEIHKKNNPPEAVCAKCDHKPEGEHPCKEHFYDDQWCLFSINGYIHFHARDACECCDITKEKDRTR